MEGVELLSSVVFLLGNCKAFLPVLATSVNFQPLGTYKA